jgi:hypothetical protein
VDAARELESAGMIGELYEHFLSTCGLSNPLENSRRLGREMAEHLRAAGVDARHDVDYALYSLYPTSDEAARHAVVLVGRFNPEAVNSYLTRELKATPPVLGMNRGVLCRDPEASTRRTGST